MRERANLWWLGILVCAMVAMCGAAAQAGWAVGAKLPALTGQHLEGTLPAVTGRVVIVDFWASWCAPCRLSFPALDALSAAYRERGLVVLGISVDEAREDMDGFLAKHPVGFSTVWDGRQKVVEAAGVDGMPTSFVVDRGGTIRFMHKGFSGAKTVAEYREQIELLLNEGGGGAP